MLETPRTVLIPGGRFLMGSECGRPDERPVHPVKVRSFRMGLTPVTTLEYAGFLASGRVPPPRWWPDPAFAAPEQPVVGVTWFDAVAYTEWLAEVAGGAWRLPTEAEWERAARGGLQMAATPWGDTIPPGEIPLGPLAAPWPAGRGTPNGYGLLDMGTIVHEWCSDWYGAHAYSSAPVLDPSGPQSGQRRSSRGGSWRHRVRWSSPSARSSLPPLFRYADYGFRVVQDLLPTPAPTASHAD